MAVLEIDRSTILGAAGDEVLAKANVTASGLTADEARRRLEEVGPNVIARDEKISILELILDQIKSPLIYVLLVAAVVTTVMHHYSDTAVILAVVLLNGIIGFVQEYKANVAMSALQGLTNPTSRVRRNGHVTRIDSADLVPGDILLLQAGDRVDADCRMLDCRELRVDESMMTGESLPVEKTSQGLLDTELTMADWLDICFAGTLVIEGRGEAIVVATGPDMELGKIAEQVKGEARIATPLQENIKKLSHQIAIATLGLSAIVVAIGAMKGLPLLEILLVAIALAVSAIPEGLPVVVTITLAISVRNMARRNALIRKLAAVETLGSTEVICSDKTGTLTQNKMTANTMVFGAWVLERSDGVSLSESKLRARTELEEPAEPAVAQAAKDQLIRVAALCNNSNVTMENGEIVDREGNPTELALLEMALMMNPDVYEMLSNRNPVAEIPFSSDRKYMASVVPVNGNPSSGLELLVKGSPEVVVSKCDRQITANGLDDIDRNEWLQTAQELASQGQRVLALAAKDCTTSPEQFGPDAVSGLVLVGLVGLIDPPRVDAAEAVRNSQNSGIQVVMVTGDHAATARTIAIELGIIRDEGPFPPIDEDPLVITGRQLQDMPDEELVSRLDEVRVFARVTPHDKHRLVRLFREQGRVVAVTGDGVNDAPALKTAHLGVAMGKSGTEVARQASDMMLLDDSFATIYKAVEEGRYAFENIKKVSFFLISSGVGEVLAIISALSMGWMLPYTAVQILWINLVTNGLQDVALAFEPGEKHLANRKPRGLKKGIFDRLVIQHTIGVMFLFAIGTLVLFDWAGGGENLKEARTVAMTTMVMFQMWHVFNCRSLERSIVKVPLMTNKFLFFSVVAAMGAQLAVLYWGPLQSVFNTTGLSLAQWAAIIAVTSSVILLMEVSKWIGRRYTTSTDIN